jgi:cytochrome c553
MNKTSVFLWTAACLASALPCAIARADGGQSTANEAPHEVPAPAGVLPEARSIRDGIFRAEQSRRGEAQYLETCKRCHMRDLAGDYTEDAPPLIGDEFLANWKLWTVGDLFEFLTTEMPPKPKDRVGITEQVYVDILAFILEKNGFPAGEAELPPDFDALVLIEFDPGE